MLVHCRLPSQYPCIHTDLGPLDHCASCCVTIALFTCTLPDGFYQQQNFFGGYPPRGGGRGGYGNPGMYYGRGGGNSWRDRGDNRGPSRAPTNGKYGLYRMRLSQTLVIILLLCL